MKKAMVYFLLLAGTLLLAGCQKEGRSGSESSLIQFTAGACPETKTAYGDYDYDANNNPVWQRIDWQLNDKIRIFSPEAADRYHSEKHYADYRVVKVTPNGRESVAEIINSDITIDENGYQVGVSNPAAAENDNVNGLVWGAESKYTFYGTYPVLNGSVATTSGTPSATFTGLKIDSDQGEGDLSENMPEYGYLTAAKADVSNGTNVRLEFEPAFTAFEVTLEAEKDAGEITVLSFELESGEEAISGPFTVSYAGTTRSFDCSSATGMTAGITFPTGTTIKPKTETEAAKTLNFTVFALPQDLTQLTLRFTVLDENDEEVERSLDLSYAKATTVGDKTYAAGDFVEFAACKKHRIYGIAMPNEVWRFAIQLSGVAMPWELKNSTTSFAEHILTSPFKITGCLEPTDSADPGYNNYYPAGTRDYNVRTMDMRDATHRWFEVTFTPSAPEGGYWKLLPEGVAGLGSDAFQVKLVLDEEVETSDLVGRIMGNPVKLRIYPNVTDAQRTEDHAIIIKALFSNTLAFEDNSTYSADSEIQDAHRDGTFSWWRFVIPQTND